MISITVPVYNEADSIMPLHGQIAAVLAEIGRRWEIIFVNDGSTDGSAAILDQLAKAYHRAVIKDVKLYGEMHRFIPIYASWHGARVTELPVRHHPRIYGKSKYGLERTLKLVLDLIVVKFLATYAQKPMYLFGGIGL